MYDGEGADWEFVLEETFSVFGCGLVDLYCDAALVFMDDLGGEEGRGSAAQVHEGVQVGNRGIIDCLGVVFTFICVSIHGAVGGRGVGLADRDVGRRGEVGVTNGNGRGGGEMARGNE